jgi:hypothetical protein
LAEAQDSLIRCGAISYGIYEMTERYEGTGLKAVPADLIVPVRGLRATLGQTRPA